MLVEKTNGRQAATSPTRPIDRSGRRSRGDSASKYRWAGNTRSRAVLHRVRDAAICAMTSVAKKPTITKTDMACPHAVPSAPVTASVVPIVAAPLVVATWVGLARNSAMAL